MNCCTSKFKDHVLEEGEAYSQASTTKATLLRSKETILSVT